MLFSKLHLNKNSFAPLYSQLHLAITGMIQKGQLKEGDRLPSEHDLCRELGVSRHTVRQSLARLMKDGYIFSVPGKGSFVTAQRSTKRLAIAVLVIGFSEEIYQSRQGVYGSFIRGVAEVTAARGVLFNILHFDLSSPFVTCLASIDPNLYDAILVRTYENVVGADIDALEGTGLPYVVVKRRLPGRIVPAVLIDEIKGGYLAVEHLIQAGHRRIGVVTGPRHIQVFADRIAGAEQALLAHGLRLEANLVASGPNSIDKDGFACAARLLDVAPRPTALFVASDLMALGAYEAIRQRRLRIADDISVVGFDDIEPASRLSPPLTTVRTSYFTLGETGTTLLLEQLQGLPVSGVERIIDPVLIVRESTRNLARSV